MRLQLIVLAVAVRIAHADDGTDGTVRVYADDDHITVISPSASARFHVTPHLQVETAVAADAVTGASVDVITSASPGTVHERRVEGTVGVAEAIRPTANAGFRVVASHEHDYDSLHLALTGSLELAKRNTVLGATYDDGFERAGSVIDPTFHDGRRTHRAIATLSQVIDRRTVADAIVELARDRGYQASPYRTVVIEDAMTTGITRLAEVTPRLRDSAAASVGMRRAVLAHSAVHATYRYYVDDWHMHSHTAAADVATELAGGTRLALAARGYWQDGAYFYRDHYSGTPMLRTRDRTLGPMRTAAVTGVVDVPLTSGGDDGPRVVCELGALRMWFLDFTPQHERTALITAVGVTTPF